ncbi:MAG: T9SS type A sorting domain-containing protein [Bacteroidetes bacterium]|nr:T9SS C-terminal target domain-containing protein [Bacteroidota bacterium]NOG56436.1 T9SS type A sorting domain-containing protein [Bacteroidota bacterium]
MKRLGFTLMFGILAIILQAQPYTIDPSFLPYFDIRTNTPYGGRVADVWENPKNGKLFIVGDFDVGGSGIPPHSNFTQTQRSGVFNSNFSASVGGGQTRSSIYPINDTMFALISEGLYLQLDTFGTLLNNAFFNNYWRTASCRTGVAPYFFPDGSSLMANYRGGQPTSCQIYSYNDTFPHQYIVKLNPQGLYDSSFQASPNYQPQGFFKYDSSRILVYGLPRSFTQYNGKTINGLCRIYHDGTLDTTFSSPLKNSFSSSFFIKKVNSDGSLFINGYVELKNDTAGKIRYLVKLKPDGVIDSSFNFAIQLTSTVFPGAEEIRSIAETPDGGYLVGGVFDSYNGYTRSSIVKIDSVGNVEPQYFLGAGPDSSGQNGSGLAGVVGIKASKLGGYYVYGDFLKWDGQPSQPIVRIHDLLTGVESQKLKAESLELYPNPSNGIINISNSENIESIRIYNLQGQLIKKLKSRQKQFELPEQTGMYIIQVEDEKGNVITKKIVKNNY